MIDRESGRELFNAIEVHTIEMTKFRLDERNISNASKLEQWVFLLLFAQEYDAETLRRLLPGIEFESAISTIEIISAKTEDKQMYDQREKAQRDYEWAISGAREEGREAGREEGREAGMVVGIEQGLIAGRIQLMQELLGEQPTETAALRDLELKALRTQLDALQQRMRDRPA
jgi:flagellar biosynthesis/type III secretory pathway protein FliH